MSVLPYRGGVFPGRHWSSLVIIGRHRLSLAVIGFQTYPAEMGRGGDDVIPSLLSLKVGENKLIRPYSWKDWNLIVIVLTFCHISSVLIVGLCNS